MNSFEDLVAPISTEQPTGSYLKLDRTEYRALRNEYNSALSSFRQLLDSPEALHDAELVDANNQNWALFQETLSHSLCHRTKDLELLTWYITTLIFTPSPLTELETGFKLLNHYIATFWDTLHPTLPDNKYKSESDAEKTKERAEFRVKPLAQFIGDAPDAGALFMPSQFINLIGDINYSTYFQAERAGTLDELKQKARSQFDSSVTDGIHAIAAILSQLEETEATLKVQSLSSSIAPINFKFVKTLFEDHLLAIKTLVGDQYDVWPLDNASSTSSANTNEADTAIKKAPSELTGKNQTFDLTAEQTATSLNDDSTQAQRPQPSTPPAKFLNSSAQVSSREQAFMQLKNLADYFRQTEPHSPTSYLLERAIQWGHLSLPELMNVLIGHDKSAINHIDALIGVTNMPIAPTNVTTNPLSESGTKNVQPTSSSFISDNDAVGSASANNNTEANQTDSSSDVSDFNW